MNYINTRNAEETVSFKTATLKGLAKNGGLYMPSSIPLLTKLFFDNITELSDIEISVQIMLPFVEASLTESELKTIITETLSFPTPVVKVEKDIYALELFHGPTMAFKDVGARFMSRCLSRLSDKKIPTTVLVATSGDTGSAVANGFANVDGINVKILFPKNKISRFQEYQMTSMGGNIQALEVDGTFDDCQALVKRAFSDKKLNKQLQLSSANSINVARFLPQMLYYFLAYKQLKSKIKGRNWIISVPSGNFGNLTAGIIARKMGLPIHTFIAANNSNDTFYNYLQTNKYIPRTSVSTFSNAMDVGVPSNFERIQHLYNSNIEAIKRDICAYRTNDEQTINEIRNTFLSTGYTLDPHGAVGLYALRYYMNKGQVGLFLETAHPSKFENIVKMAIPNYPIKEVNLNGCSKVPIGNSYLDFVNELQK